MLYALGVLLGLVGFSLAGAGIIGLLNRAFGWEMRIRSVGGQGMVVPDDLGLGLASLGLGLVLLGLAWLLTRDRR